MDSARTGPSCPTRGARWTSRWAFPSPARGKGDPWDISPFPGSSSRRSRFVSSARMLGASASLDTRTWGLFETCFPSEVAMGSLSVRLMKDRRYELVPTEDIVVLNSRDRDKERFQENIRSIEV